MSITQDSCESGFFLTLEGIDYSGKSSLCDLIQARLSAKKIPFARFRQPDRNSSYYKKVVQFSKRSKEKQNPIDLARIFIQERILLSQKINIALAKNLFVFCDRFDISTFAYQGGYGADIQSIWELHQYGQPVGTIEPDVTVFLDIPPEVALQRSISSNRTKEIFDVYFDQFSQQLSSFEEISLHYKTAIQWMKKIHPDRKFATIDATTSLSDMADQVLSFTTI